MVEHGGVSPVVAKTGTAINNGEAREVKAIVTRAPCARSSHSFRRVYALFARFSDRDSFHTRIYTLTHIHIHKIRHTHPRVLMQPRCFRHPRVSRTSIRYDASHIRAHIRALSFAIARTDRQTGRTIAYERDRADERVGINYRVRGNCKGLFVNLTTMCLGGSRVRMEKARVSHRWKRTESEGRNGAFVLSIGGSASRRQTREARTGASV